MVVPRPLNAFLARVHSRLPNGWGDAFLQILLFAFADLLYEGVRGLVTGRTGVALLHGEQIVSMERSMGIFVEPAMQGWILGNNLVVQAFNWAYANVHFTLNVIFVGWLYVKRHNIYAFVRNMYVVAMGLALTVHLMLPVAPPRLLGGYGFVDTIKDISHVNQDSGAIGLLVNPYAAVPSMHVCFAVIAGATGVAVTQRRWAKAIWALYPLFVTFVVVVTANHYFLDAVAGLAAAAVAALISHQVMARVRPHAWAPARARVTSPA